MCPRPALHALLRPLAVAQAVDVDANNRATDTPGLKSGRRGLAVVRAQILVDRGWFSSGEIDGRIAKIFFCQAGGRTGSHLDPGGEFACDCAHLGRDADDLAEGTLTQKGQVIGCVGSPANPFGVWVVHR